MAATPKLIVPPTVLTAAAVAYYEVKVNQALKVQKISLTNTTVDARTVTIHYVAPSGAAGAGNIEWPARVVPPSGIAGNPVEPVEIYHVLEAGWTIHALCDAGSAVTMTISGILFS